ncbi:MAG: hypothetical protein HY047_21580 [Acidobacteria bacterium]|nr:hypothetical protein [Acidobacteriota bacterium]
MEQHRTSSVIAETPERVGRPPRSWERLGDRYPSVVAAYDALSDVCRWIDESIDETLADRP